MQDEEEEEEGTIDLDDDDYCPDDDLVCSCYGDADQHNADAEFEGHVGEDVDGLACPPPLEHVSTSMHSRYGDIPSIR